MNFVFNIVHRKQVYTTFIQYFQTTLTSTNIIRIKIITIEWDRQSTYRHRPNSTSNMIFITIDIGYISYSYVPRGLLHMNCWYSYLVLGCARAYDANNKTTSKIIINANECKKLYFTIWSSHAQPLLYWIKIKIPKCFCLFTRLWILLIFLGLSFIHYSH